MRERRCGGAHEQSLSDGDRHTDNSTCFVVGRGGLQEQASSLRLAPAEAFKCDQQSGTCVRKARSKRRNDHPGRPGHTLRGAPSVCRNVLGRRRFGAPLIAAPQHAVILATG